MHPCRSTEGLREIARWLEEVVFIRIKRDPLEIAESFVAARSFREANPGIARHDDHDVVRFIRSESENVAAQRSFIDPIEVRYEDFAAWSFNRLIELGFDVTPIYDYIRDTYGSQPVRHGRLSVGRSGERFTSDEERTYFESRLRSVAAREGY